MSGFSHRGPCSRFLAGTLVCSAECNPSESFWWTKGHFSGLPQKQLSWQPASEDRELKHSATTDDWFSSHRSETVGSEVLRLKKNNKQQHHWFVTLGYGVAVTHHVIESFLLPRGEILDGNRSIKSTSKSSVKIKWKHLGVYSLSPNIRHFVYVLTETTALPDTCHIRWLWYTKRSSSHETLDKPVTDTR